MAVNLKYLLICARILSVVSALTLPYEITLKPRHRKYSSPITAPGNDSSAIPVSQDTDSDAAIYRYSNSNGGTCILLKTDALVEVSFLLHNLTESAVSYIPTDALVDGNCKDEDASFLSISWKGYNVVLDFAKTPGGERWYIKHVELTTSPELPQFHGIRTHGKLMKLYNREILMFTPIGKSYSCAEVEINLTPDDEDHPPAGLKGTIFLRMVRLQSFMYKSEDFEAAFECNSQRVDQAEMTSTTAASSAVTPIAVVPIAVEPIAAASILGLIAVLITALGYGIFRYIF